MDADDLVGLGAEEIERVSRGDGDCNNDAGRVQFAGGSDGGEHGVARSEAVVDENDGLAREDKRWPGITIHALLAEKLFVLPGDHGVDGGLWNTETCDRVLVKDNQTVYRDGADGIFRMAGSAEFADGKDVEGKAELSGQNGGDGHPTSGKREDERIGLAAVGGELGSEEFAGVLAIAEHTGLDAIDQAWGLPVINKEWSVMSSRKLISMRMETML
jgi:hypothetical protein